MRQSTTSSPTLSRCDRIFLEGRLQGARDGLEITRAIMPGSDLEDSILDDIDELEETLIQRPALALVR